MTILTLLNPPVYKTTILVNGGNMGITFDNTYRAYLTDEKYGKLHIEYEDGLEDWTLNANFKKAGKTEVVLEDPNGEKTMFDITIKRDTFDMTKK